MGVFSTNRRGTDRSLPRNDRGFGHLEDYTYDLRARNRSLTIVLADSDPHQDALREIAESGEEKIETAVPPRTIEQERSDAPMEVRVFTGRRVVGPIGSVPRGLESIVDDTLRRLEDTTGKNRIPVRVFVKRGRYRAELLMGAVR